MSMNLNQLKFCDRATHTPTRDSGIKNFTDRKEILLADYEDTRGNGSWNAS